MIFPYLEDMLTMIFEVNKIELTLKNNMKFILQELKFKASLHLRQFFKNDLIVKANR